MKLLLIVIAISLSACQTISRETQIEEVAWQSLNVTDAILTHNQLSQHPTCAIENGPWKRISGEHPNTAHIAMAAIAWGGLHYVVTDIMANEDAPAWLQRTWQFVTIGSTTGVIIGNIKDKSTDRARDCYRTELR